MVSIDIGVKFNGWCGDAAVTHPIGELDPVSAKLLLITEDNLRLAISLRSAGSKRTTASSGPSCAALMAWVGPIVQCQWPLSRPASCT